MGTLFLIILIVAALNAGTAKSGTIMGVIVRWMSAPMYAMSGREPMTAEEYRALRPYIIGVSIGVPVLIFVLPLIFGGR
jgi:hypothetical protein